MASIPRIFTDKNLNFVANPITGDIATITGATDVTESIKNLVLTNHFDRLFHPEIGSSVTRLLFNNATTPTAAHIQNAIQEVITNFEPRATLSQVIVNLMPDQNTFSVNIVYFLKNVTTPVSVTFFLNLLR